MYIWVYHSVCWETMIFLLVNCCLICILKTSYLYTLQQISKREMNVTPHTTSIMTVLVEDRWCVMWLVLGVVVGDVATAGFVFWLINSSWKNIYISKLPWKVWFIIYNFVLFQHKYLITRHVWSSEQWNFIQVLPKRI